MFTLLHMCCLARECLVKRCVLGQHWRAVPPNALLKGDLLLPESASTIFQLSDMLSLCHADRGMQSVAWCDGSTRVAHCPYDGAQYIRAASHRLRRSAYLLSWSVHGTTALQLRSVRKFAKLSQLCSLL